MPYGSEDEEEDEEDEEEWEASCRDTQEAEEERDREAGPSEHTVLTEVQDDAPRSPDDIIRPTIPLRDEAEDGRFTAALLEDVWLPRRDPSGMM